jgi:hypothetical protein
MSRCCRNLYKAMTATGGKCESLKAMSAFNQPIFGDLVGFCNHKVVPANGDINNVSGWGFGLLRHQSRQCVSVGLRRHLLEPIEATVPHFVRHDLDIHFLALPLRTKLVLHFNSLRLIRRDQHRN